MIKIKICGVKTIEIANFLLKQKVDYLGLVFVKESPRFVDLKTAKKIADTVRGNIKIVGLFQDNEIAFVKKIHNQINLDYVQLHGFENTKYVNDLKNEINSKIIKVINIFDKKDLKIVEKYKGLVDGILFDAKTNIRESLEKKVNGGLGKVFDWNILKNFNTDFNTEMSWFLSGGLNLNNVMESLKITGAKNIDVSSGVEKSRGIKSKKLIKEFIYNARNGQM